jgi:hypothetical protein
MSTAATKALIGQAVTRLQADLPALRQLNLVVRLELPARGGDAPIWRVEVPGPKVTKDAAGDARMDVTVIRSRFNDLAAEGHLRDWVEAYDRGHVRVTGDQAVTRLLASVIERQLSRARG